MYEQMGFDGNREIDLDKSGFAVILGVMFELTVPNRYTLQTFKIYTEIYNAQKTH